MIDGILGLSGWGKVVAVLVMTHITIISVTVFLHRHQAHRALDLHPALSHFFRFWLWLTTGIQTRAWVAIHRKHHAKCETEEDPHSPRILGIRKVLWEGAELYREEAKNTETLERYGRGTPDDWLERHVYDAHSYTGIVLMFFLDILLFGIAGISVWAVQMLWIPLFAAGVINGIGHWWGYRNYEVPDASTNIVPWGILIGGEELHNNHHTFATSAKLSAKWWELDIGWLYIRLFQGLGLASVNKRLTRPRIDPDKTAIDMDTVRAVVNHRFQVMAHYCRDVVHQVHRDEMNKADASYRERLKKVRRLLIREASLIDESARLKLREVLSDNHRLDTVYRFKLELQELWKRSSESNEKMLHALQEWCRRAEASGIQTLELFAQQLQGYSLQTARS